ncbi:single-stranded DNA-binding protein [Bifidobacterium biavatii]|uniref:Single-stranded DNA-binding protein n=1 Tax=Bifidobacterium biavatii DSM 23969 TaxID=1437608 RepID=A0A086ZU46_9BIFI|nr:single-stranded DNA-binding protein [Bifidobacterium biavatii]KFI50046.1 ssb2 [Bifidobacterium biavatii DSM 23969]
MANETMLTIVGNLTADPELRTIGSGVNVASFTIASTPRTWNRQSNQWEDSAALFMRCSAWRDLADHVTRSLSKGDRVIAQGRLQQRSYQAQDGTNRTVMELQVDEIGPSLRYATAAVARVAQAKPRNGYAGGATYGQQAAAPSAPQVDTAAGGPEDPWGGGQSFGGSADFGGHHDSDPEF